MQLIWPDELRTYVEQEAEKAGFASVDEFTLQVFLKANSLDDSDEDVDSILGPGIAADELEREILKGINSGPATPMTPSDWVEIRKRVERRLAAKQS